jgi:hypothetical protein
LLARIEVRPLVWLFVAPVDAVIRVAIVITIAITTISSTIMRWTAATALILWPRDPAGSSQDAAASDAVVTISSALTSATIAGRTAASQSLMSPSLFVEASLAQLRQTYFAQRVIIIIDLAKIAAASIAGSGPFVGNLFVVVSKLVGSSDVLGQCSCFGCLLRLWLSFNRERSANCRPHGTCRRIAEEPTV